MRNHAEKRRDMCRSILPSTARVRARGEIAAWKRHHRRAIRQQIQDAMGYDWLDYEGTTLAVDTNRPVNGGSGWDKIIRHLVNDRRNSDKVAPLIRWVEAIKNDLPGEDDEAKYYALKSLLPDNLIGRHALSHVEHLFDLPENRYDYRWRYRDRETKEERQRRVEAEKETFTALVRTVVENMHAAFNAEFAGDPCYGLHDVERWAGEHWHAAHYSRDDKTKIRLLKILGR